MYLIQELLDGTYQCSLSIQDGTERWCKRTKTEAIQSMITAARIWNGCYITPKEIKEIPFTTTKRHEFSPEEEKLLFQIKSGEKVVLNFDDKRIRYNITDEDCELIISIREGTTRI